MRAPELFKLITIFKEVCDASLMSQKVWFSNTMRKFTKSVQESSQDQKVQ